MKGIFRMIYSVVCNRRAFCGLCKLLWLLNTMRIDCHGNAPGRLIGPTRFQISFVTLFIVCIGNLDQEMYLTRSMKPPCSSTCGAQRIIVAVDTFILHCAFPVRGFLKRWRIRKKTRISRVKQHFIRGRLAEASMSAFLGHTGPSLFICSDVQ